MNLDIEFKLSLYEELKMIHKSNKVKIFLVQNIHDEKIYIKKEIREYTKDVYESIKNIKSNNMPKIYEIFEIEDKLIIIEEFINGDTLQSILESENKLDEKIVIKYMVSLCEILNEIHSLNPPIIHRDIKPANIIISNDKVLKLIDFDISRTYKEGENLDTTLLGTKGYASPEQFGFDQTDCRSDIYAIGVMMNVLTTGKHIKEELNKSLLKDIIKKCTHISANERYENVLALKQELEVLIYDENKIINIKNEVRNNQFIDKDYVHHKSVLKQIPGFRSGNLFYMLLASLWYLFLVVGLFVGNNFNEFIENITLVIMLLLILFICTNFLNIQKKLPIIRSEKKYFKIFGCVLYSLILLLIAGGLLTLL
ncbi:MAG: serine/threonine-protein kinase [Terrisporobacter sp.]|uniref:serine/threonine-protein kinase n=1 Tax=Terrisporobacter sp. TaxID=1965305 RepID=UPI002FCB23ED